MCVHPYHPPQYASPDPQLPQVRIYEVNPTNLATQGRAMHAHQGPVLDVVWNKEGTRVFSGGADNAVRMYDLGGMASTQVAQHDAPVKSVRWVETPQGGLLATGSWDKSVKVCFFSLCYILSREAE